VATATPDGIQQAIERVTSSGEQRQIEVRLQVVTEAVGDPVPPELLTRELASVAVANDDAHPLVAQEASGLGDHAGRVERRLPRAEHVDDDVIILPMSDSQRE
jgi:hypothetical protein